MPVTIKKPGALSKADLQFKIEQLRQDKLIFSIASIKISFICVLTAVFLPEILFRTLYGNGASQMNTDILGWIPMFSYAAAVLFFVFAGIGNIMRWKMIKKLENMWSEAQR